MQATKRSHSGTNHCSLPFPAFLSPVQKERLQVKQPNDHADSCPSQEISCHCLCGVCGWSHDSIMWPTDMIKCCRYGKLFI